MPRIIIAHELLGIFFAHESHGLTRRLCATGMATGSVALIYTNAMRGGCDDNRDNLGQLEVVLGATEMPRNIIAHELLGNIFFAHELHKLARIVAMDKWRPGRSH